MFSFSESGSIRPVARVLGGELDRRIVYLHRRDATKPINTAAGEFDRLDLEGKSTFEWLPTTDDAQTDSIAISSVRGSGKSVFGAGLAHTIANCFKLGSEAVTICAKTDVPDPAFAKLDHELLLVDREFADDVPTLDDVSQGEPGNYTPSLVICDDLDIQPSAKLKRAVISFVDDLLLNGRKRAIYLINIVHRLAKSLETRFLLSESTFIAFSPSAPSSDIRYICDKYLDISVDLLRELKKLNTRFVMFHQFSPRYILADRSVWIVDPDRDLERHLTQKIKQRRIINSRVAAAVDESSAADYTSDESTGASRAPHERERRADDGESARRADSSVADVRGHKSRDIDRRPARK